MVEVFLALFLFLTIGILTVLIFIGYNMHIKRNKTAEITEILAEKESDLIDLYNLMENMINEMDLSTKKAVDEIYQVRDEIKKWRDEILSANNNIEPVPRQNKEQQQREIIPDENIASSGGDNCKNLKEIKIKALYNRGTSIPDIAREMNIGQGEVQLILNLEKKIV